MYNAKRDSPVTVAAPFCRAGLPQREMRPGISCMCTIRDTIVRPSRRKHIVTHALPVQKNLTRTKRRSVKTRRLHSVAHIKCVPQRLHQIRNPREEMVRSVALGWVISLPLGALRAPPEGRSIYRCSFNKESPVSAAADSNLTAYCAARCDSRHNRGTKVL